MTEDRNIEDRYVVTDHERIRRLAEAEGAEPVSVERGEDSGDVRLRPTPDDPDADRITWEEFFDRFEGANRAVQYRPDESGPGSDAVLEVVDRSTRTMPVSDDEPAASPHEVDTDPIAGGDAADRDDRRRQSDRDATPAANDATEDPADVETEPLATGDTGDAEPVAFERTEGAVDHDDADEAAVAPASDSERAQTPGTEGLVLDEIHGSRSGSGDVSDEYLVFENAGERPIDLSGWTIENGHGRSYRFPPETVLEPGTRLALHSGAGDDEAGHRYWDSPVPVWDDKRIEVVVETATGERVLRETYET